ncbi:hypothetical protein GDO86_006701 [Hymenochirus boettgeri]|nr:hypothetical protein GDO86_006701 [Hymenochirus boettgeri]
MVPSNSGYFKEIKTEDQETVPEISPELKGSDMVKEWDEDDGLCDFLKTKSENCIMGSHVDATVDQPESNNEETETKTEAWSVSTPSREESHRLTHCHTPVDFSNGNVEDLGITSDSFSKCAGKSPKSQMKHRRRSTIGVRGSPEMNFLIRQIALQKSKEKKEPDPLENPFVSPRNTLLKDKMSAFREAFQVVEEDEGKFNNVTAQSETVNKGEERTEPPQKKKRLHSYLANRPAAIKPPSQPLESNQPKLNTSVCEKILRSDCTAVQPVFEVQPAPLPCNEDTGSKKCSSKGRKRKVMFLEMESSEMPEKSSLSNPPPRKNPEFTQPCSVFTLRPALKKTPRRDAFVNEQSELQKLGEEKGILLGAILEPQDQGDEWFLTKKTECTNNSAKKKRVTFGKDLSPELFDKFLPANTPLRRGATPYNHHKSEDMTPAKEPLEQMKQPDFDSADEPEATLKPLSLYFEAEPSEAPEHVVEPKKVGECRLDVSILEEDSISLATEPANDKSFFIFESAATAGRVTRSLKRKNFGSEDGLNTNLVTTQHISESPKLSEENVKPKKDKKPVRVVAKKSQIRAPRGKGKKGRVKSKKMKYVDRETVSKKPLLSPIPELPECLPTPPASSDVSLGSKTSIKRATKIKSVRRGSGKVKRSHAGFICDKSKDLLPSNLFNIENSEKNKPVEEIKSVSFNSGRNDTCVNNLLVSDPAIDSFIQADSSKDSIHVPDKLVLEVSLPIRKESEAPKVSGDASLTRRHSLKNKTGSREIMDVKPAAELPVAKTQDPDIINGPDSLKKETFDFMPVHVALVKSQDNIVQIEGLISNNFSTIDTVSSVTEKSKTKKSRRSSKIHCGSMFVSSIPSEGSTVKGPADEDPIASVCFEEKSVDEVFSIEDILQSSSRGEKRVRRSMRLRRDSEVAGLSWIQEEKVEERKGRRKSMCTSVVTQVESYQQLLKETVCHPYKESKPAPDITKNSRRRTLCTSTLQKDSSVSDWRETLQL